MGLYFAANKACFVKKVCENIDVFPFICEFKIYDKSKLINVFNQQSFEFVNTKIIDNKQIDTFINKDYNVEIKRYIEEINGNYCFYLKAINKGNYVVKLCKLTSICISGIFSNIDDNKLDNYELYTLKSGWCCENELTKENLKELYLPLFNVRNESNEKSICSETSFTTKTYGTTIFIKDKVNNVCHGLLVEPLGRWEISYLLNRCKYENIKTLTLTSFTGQNSKNDFYLNLNKNDEYETFKSIFTSANSIDEVVENLNKYKKSTIKVNNPNGLVIFNDYLNCHWAKPSEIKTKKLIDAVSDLGVDVFVMDSGWYKDIDETDWFGNLGDWMANDLLFGKSKFKGIIDYTISKKMLFGLWFELEVVTPKAKIANKDESWFLHIGNERIFESGRYFLDIRNQEVVNYLVNKVKFYYDLGVRYIKNDYNGSFRGVSKDNAGSLIGLEEYELAIANLYDNIRMACPDILIENCASGAMRADNHILRHVNYQSFSDCENYKKYPAIISGSLYNILPSQLGIWSVAIPQVYEKLDDICFETNAPQDIDNTIFSLVSGFLGVMYISGRVDLANNENKELLKEAVSTYKQYKDYVSDGVPYHINGDISFNSNEGIVALGLKKNDSVLLAIYHLQDKENTFSISCKNAKIVYPKKANNYSFLDEKLEVKFEKNYQARLFEIKL